jgi:4-hydroxy-tetrahydrodipicolinate reductase
MGRMLVTCALDTENIVLKGAVEISDHECMGRDIGEVCGLGKTGIQVHDSVEKVVEKGDIIIDFTSVSHTMVNIETAQSLGAGMIIGTTGLSDQDQQRIKQAGLRIPIVIAPNMSVGINLLFKLTEQAAGILNQGYDIEIVEAHHNKKKDAPSGTALGLAKSAAAGIKRKLEDVACYGRQGMTGQRKTGEIGIHAVRGGDIVGEHTVMFCCEGERVEFTHKASSRMTFARGAIKAALFLDGKDKGLFNMQQVLGL